MIFRRGAGHGSASAGGDLREAGGRAGVTVGSLLFDYAFLPSLAASDCSVSSRFRLYVVGFGVVGAAAGTVGLRADAFFAVCFFGSCFAPFFSIGVCSVPETFTDAVSSLVSAGFGVPPLLAAFFNFLFSASHSFFKSASSLSIQPGTSSRFPFKTLRSRIFAAFLSFVDVSP